MKLVAALLATPVLLFTHFAFAAEPVVAPTLRLNDQTAARGVVERVPQAPGVRFPADVGQVWAFVDVANAGAPTQISQRWMHGGKVKFEAKLAVGASKSWHTWSRRRIGPKDAGTWTVETVGPDGVEIGTLVFDVEPVAVGPVPATAAR